MQHRAKSRGAGLSAMAASHPGFRKGVWVARASKMQPEETLSEASGPHPLLPPPSPAHPPPASPRSPASCLQVLREFGVKSGLAVENIDEGDAAFVISQCDVNEDGAVDRCTKTGRQVLQFGVFSSGLINTNGAKAMEFLGEVVRRRPHDTVATHFFELIAPKGSLYGAYVDGSV